MHYEDIKFLALSIAMIAIAFYLFWLLPDGGVAQNRPSFRLMSPIPGVAGYTLIFDPPECEPTPWEPDPLPKPPSLRDELRRRNRFRPDGIRPQPRGQFF